jgi:uncharacterized protein (TIGR02266 family)
VGLRDVPGDELIRRAVTSASRSELEKAGVQAARDARLELARLAEDVAPQSPDLARSVTAIVGTLFGVEVADAERIYAGLGSASSALRVHLEVHEWSTDEDVARAISRALAMIHPAKTELGRALGKESRDESTAPFLLTSSRSRSEPPSDERREDPREEIEVEVGLEGENRFYTGRTGDVSGGGLFVASDEPLAVGTPIVLSFVLPDGYRVRASASVAWVRAPRYRPHELPAGMGVRFDRLGKRERRAIEHFLEQRPAFHYGD